MVASWACEVTGILTQRSTKEASLVRDTVTTQAKIATKYEIHITVSVVYDTF